MFPLRIREIVIPLNNSWLTAQIVVRALFKRREQHGNSHSCRRPHGQDAAGETSQVGASTSARTRKRFNLPISSLGFIWSGGRRLEMTKPRHEAKTRAFPLSGPDRVTGSSLSLSMVKLLDDQPLAVAMPLEDALVDHARGVQMQAQATAAIFHRRELRFPESSWRRRWRGRRGTTSTGPVESPDSREMPMHQRVRAWASWKPSSELPQIFKARRGYIRHQPSPHTVQSPNISEHRT